jgi:tetratricopeptide (TPR) repeat protein
MHLRQLPRTLLILGCLSLSIGASSQDSWDGPSFSADPSTFSHVAQSIRSEKGSEATVLLNEVLFRLEEDGKTQETRHFIYRVETQDGVKDLDEVSGEWEAWHQARPEIRARVINGDGSVHWLDPKTLVDLPVHQDVPSIYSDERQYGGPLPAVAVGSIVEEEVIVRDTTPLFAAGTALRWTFRGEAPVNKTRFVIIHPASSPLRYEVQLMPGSTVRKSTTNGSETITIEQGPMAASTGEIPHVPGDLPLHPEIEFSTGTSWHQVATEYARLSSERLRQQDVEILTKRIKERNGTRIELIRQIVSAIHAKVRYTGVEFGESQLIPQFPSETLKRGYGDCKDEAALLVTMLRSAGIPASLALLKAGPGRELNTNLPGMGMFDHAIVYVPASGSDSDLWIDATAQYSRVGMLPWMDYGRWALIIDDKTDSLKKIPSITSAENLHRESRDVSLAEYGMATFVEKDEEIGPDDTYYREYYSGESQQIREGGENYVKDAYLADSLTSLDYDDPSNLEKPFSVRFVAKGKRGYTDLTSAIVAIRTESLFDRLPSYFTTQGSDVAGENPRPRTADWLITPFMTEWRYMVMAPLGFRVRTLPSDKSETVDTVSFSQKFSTNSEGTVVVAILRVENPNTRITVDQAKSLREAVLRARTAEPILIAFDNIGHSMISAGKIREGLAAYREIVARHPKEALHQVQLADALLTVGLGEEARSVAAKATALEPNSALAQSNLGMVLENDLIGRPMKMGMDYDGAVVAYQKAISLDPKDKDTRADLALLFEYDGNGTRYSNKARLKDAVQAFRELKKVNEEYSQKYDDNILYDLWYLRDYKGVLSYAESLPASDVRRGFVLAVIATEEGADAALNRSMEITTGNEERSQALANAGALLLTIRKYGDAAALIAEGAHGQTNESQAMRRANIFATTKPFDAIAIDPSNPRSVVQQFFGETLSGQLTVERFKSRFYFDPQNADEMQEVKEFDAEMSALKSEMSGTGLSLDNIADLVVSNLHFTVEGDDSLGYHIIVEGPGAAQDVYVVKRGNQYKIAAFDFESLGTLALQAIESNNQSASRKWLDRARDKIHISGGDDPLAGEPFPYFWTKGQPADSPTMRTAALVLSRSTALKGPYLTELDEARHVAKTDLDRDRLTMVMSYAYASQEKWTDMLPLAEELIKAQPTSIQAFEIATRAYAGSQRFGDWENLVQGRLHQYPDEVAYVRSSAMLAAYRSEFAKSREILKGIIDSGQANAFDLNQYAWYSLLLPVPVEQSAIDMAQRANDLSKNADFSVLHTLACVDAQAGMTTQARDLLLKAMDVAHLEQPNSEVWFGLALIAEQYGVLDAADKMYSRVDKQKPDVPGSSFVIAQRHREALHATAKTAAGLTPQTITDRQ